MLISVQYMIHVAVRYVDRIFKIFIPDRLLNVCIGVYFGFH